MNREQIIKALECCSEAIFCARCPAVGFCDGVETLMANALALIRHVDDDRVQMKIATVRKTAERIKQAICDNTYPDFNKDGKPVNVWSAVNGYDAIDKIVEEMLNERIDP